MDGRSLRSVACTASSLRMRIGTQLSTRWPVRTVRRRRKPIDTPPNIRRLTLVLALTTMSFCLLAGSAAASRTQQSVIEDPARLLGDTTSQNASLDEMKLLGAEIVKLPVVWRSIAPAVKTSDLNDPNAY